MVIPLLSPNSGSGAFARHLYFWMVRSSLQAKHRVTPKGVIFPGCGRDGTWLISLDVSMPCHCFLSLLYLHTLMYSNFFSALKAALLQQPITVCHGAVLSCAPSMYNLCPDFQVLSGYSTIKPHIRHKVPGSVSHSRLPQPGGDKPGRTGQGPGGVRQS